jgi:formylglycine-generating enzyme required for sulfatase activity
MKKNKKIFLLIITTFAFLTFLNSGLTIKLENSVYRLSVKLVSILNAQQCLCDECNCNVNVDIPVPLPVIIDNTPLPVSLQEINPGLLPLSVAEAPSSPIFQYYYQLVNRDLSKFRFSQYVQEAVLFYLTSAKTSCEYFMKVIDVTVKDQRICRNVVENWGNFLEDIPKNVRLETARQLDTAAGLDSDLKEELINSLDLTLEEYELYPQINSYENLILQGTQGIEIEDTESLVGSFFKLTNPFFNKQGLYNITKNYLDAEQEKAEKIATLEAQSGEGALSSQECVAEAFDTVTGQSLGCVKYRANMTEAMAKTSIEKAITYDLDAIVNSSFPLDSVYQSTVVNTEKNDQGIWQGGPTIVRGLLNSLNTEPGTNIGIFNQPVIPMQGEDIEVPIGPVPSIIIQPSPIDLNPTPTSTLPTPEPPTPLPESPTPGPESPTPGPESPVPPPETSEWVLVPKNPALGTNNDFWVMKYEAKYDKNGDGVGDTASEAKCPANSGLGLDWRDQGCNTPSKIVSTAEGAPIVNITHNQAKAACQAIGAHLITNQEWMTIARNVEQVNKNWTMKELGSGCLFMGNNGETICGYDGKDPDYGSVRDSRAKLILSNNQEIYDFSGNVNEHVMKNNNDTLVTKHPTDGGATGYRWIEHTAIQDYGDFSYNEIRPSDDLWDSTQGMGRIYSYNGSNANRVLLRGGSWPNGLNDGVFSLNLSWYNDWYNSDVGFRCVSPHNPNP